MRKLMIELDEGPSISICRLICNPVSGGSRGELRKNRTGWWPPASPALPWLSAHRRKFARSGGFLVWGKAT